MFRPQMMSRVKLMVPEHDIMPMTEALALSGVFHPVSSGRAEEKKVIPYTEHWQEQAASLADLERRILAAMETLRVEIGPPPATDPHPIEVELARRDVERLEQEAQESLEGIEKLQHKLDQLRHYLKQLEPLADVEVNLDSLSHLRYTFVLIGTMPVANLTRLQTSLELIPSVLVSLKHGEHLATVVLFGRQCDAEILNRAARSAYLNPLSLPKQYQTTPAEAMAALRLGIERTRQHLDEYQADIERLRSAHEQHLRSLLWRIRARHTLVKTIISYQRMRYVYLVTGWVPAAQVPALEQQVKQASDKTLIEVSSASRQERDSVPSALENSPLVKPFQSLVTTYGYPGYGEIDPTFLTALTFPLVFGIMFGDVGHGLLLALLGGLLVSRKVRALRGLAGMGGIVLVCGVAAMLFGFLYGSVFGFETILAPLWVRPLEDIMGILPVTVGIGVVILTVGMLSNLINAFWAHRWGRFLFEHNGLAGIIFYWALLGLAASFFVAGFPLGSVPLAVLVLVSALAMTFAEVLSNLIEGQRPLIEGSLSTYLIQVLVEFFESTIGLLSNTLSYVRMGAFAVAHGCLSLVVLIIAGIVSPAHGVGYWLVVIVGNLFVIGFEGLIVSIQTLRLEYYEFFSKFFAGDGVRYRPLSLISRE
ncbi:MAG: hypothetical protein J7M17_03610 [Anaerolineae bacterium]|nr:hypothetical protein [Anaerolineae bacterium]